MWIDRHDEIWADSAETREAIEREDSDLAWWHARELQLQQEMTEMNQDLSDNLPLAAAVPSSSRYLGKGDLPVEGLNLTIDRLSQEMVKGERGEEKCTVVFWRERDVKPLILKTVNREALAMVTRAQTVGELRGQVVNVFVDASVMFGPRRIGGLRIRERTDRPIPGAPRMPPPPPPPLPAATRIVAGDPSDEIPF